MSHKMIFIKKLETFFKSTYHDDRIPVRDKNVLKILLAILLIRLLFIPDWIPYFGILDILFLLALIFDYLFDILDQSVLLSHYPWGMKSFARVRRVASFLALFAPAFIKENLWHYRKDPF